MEVLLLRGSGKIRVRLAGNFRPLRRKPGDNIRDFLADIGLPGTSPRQSGRTQLRPSDDHIGSKVLIAHQGKVRAIDNRAGLLAPSTV